jgi:hypothetical protein
MGHDELGRRPNEAQKRTQTVDQPRQRDDEKAQSKHCGQLPRTAAIQLRPFCFYWGYSDRGRQPHFRRRAYDELVEALIARGLPFALTTGHGQESIDQRYRAQSTLRKPFDFATFRRTIDELMAPSGLGAGARNASPAGPISATR